MKTALISVEVVTIHNGKMIKNIINLQIPQEAAEIINKAWHTEELPQRKVITANNLLGNPIAHCDLAIGNEVVAGMCNMVRENSDEDRYFAIEDYEED